MSVLDLLNEAADLKRYTEDYGDFGGTVRTLSTIAAAEPMRFSDRAPSDTGNGPQAYGDATGTVYLRADLAVLRDDEIHRSNDVTGTPEVYEVVGVRRVSVPNHHQEIAVKVRTDGI